MDGGRVHISGSSRSSSCRRHAAEKWIHALGGAAGPAHSEHELVPPVRLFGDELSLYHVDASFAEQATYVDALAWLQYIGAP
jgi:hypothetical protein